MRVLAFAYHNAIVPALLLLLIAGCGDVRSAMTTDASPVQPIDFKHTIHVGQDQMTCAYCHYSTSVSEDAGIPAVGTCMGCHRFIRGRTPVHQQEIEKLTQFWNDSIPIPWVRVHSVPEFVQFTHKPHVRAGVTCAACHGDVGAMERVQRVNDLSMGWCLECHRDRGASDDCAVCHY